MNKRNHFITCKECLSSFEGWGNTRYCSSDCLRLNQYRANMEKPEYRINKLLAGAKNRSKSKGHSFDLDLNYLKGLWDGSSGCCVLTGRKFHLGIPDPYQVHPDAPSIDRIEPSKGYTKGNVRFITYQTNVALSEYGIDKLKSLAADLLSFRN